MANNILGVDLKIDQEYIARSVKDVVKASMIEALGDKSRIVTEVVTQLLNQKVDRDGKIDTYGYSSSVPLIEYHLRQIICDIVKEEIKNCIEERREELSKIIKSEINKKATLNRFVDSFINNTYKVLDDEYLTKINIDFEKRKEY